MVEGSGLRKTVDRILDDGKANKVAVGQRHEATIADKKKAAPAPAPAPASPSVDLKTTRSSATQESHIAGACIKQMHRRASLLRHSKNFLKKKMKQRNSEKTKHPAISQPIKEEEVLENFGATNGTDLKTEDVATDKVAEKSDQERASPVSQLSNPSGLAEDYDSESIQSYSTYNSNDFSQSTEMSSVRTVEQQGIFGGIMAINEKAFGTLAQSFDHFFEGKVGDRDESDDDVLSFDSTPTAEPVSKRLNQKIEGFASDLSSKISDTPGSNSSSECTTQTNNRSRPTENHDMKRSASMPTTHRHGENLTDSSYPLSRPIPIKRNRSEEEIAAESMVMAVESLFGNRFNCSAQEAPRSPPRTYATPDPVIGPRVPPIASKDSARQHEKKLHTTFGLKKSGNIVNSVDDNEKTATSEVPKARMTTNPRRSKATDQTERVKKSGTKEEQSKKPELDKPESTPSKTSLPSPELGQIDGIPRFHSDAAQKVNKINTTPKSHSGAAREPNTSNTPDTSSLSRNHTKSYVPPKIEEKETAPGCQNQSAVRSSLATRGRKVRQSLGNAWRSRRSLSRDKKVVEQQKPQGREEQTSVTAVDQTGTMAISIFSESPEPRPARPMDHRAKYKSDEPGANLSVDKKGVRARSPFHQVRALSPFAQCGNSVSTSLECIEKVLHGTSTKVSTQESSNENGTKFVPQDSNGRSPRREKSPAPKHSKTQGGSHSRSPLVSARDADVNLKARDESTSAEHQETPSTTTNPPKSKKKNRDRSPLIRVRDLGANEETGDETTGQKKRTPTQKFSGFLSSIRLRRNNPVDSEPKSEGLKTTIIMENTSRDVKKNDSTPSSTSNSTPNSTPSNTHSSSPRRSGSECESPELSDDDDGIYEDHPLDLSLELRTISPLLDLEQFEGGGYFCSNMTGEVSDRCGETCKFELQEPESQEKLCHSGPVSPFVADIQSQIESFVAGLAGAVPSDQSILPNTDKSPQKESGEAVFCNPTSPTQTKREVESQEQQIRSFLNNYKDDLGIQIQNTFSLEYLEGALAQASMDLSSLAEIVSLGGPKAKEIEPSREEIPAFINKKRTESPAFITNKAKSSSAQNSLRRRTKMWADQRSSRRSTSTQDGEKVVADKPVSKVSPSTKRAKASSKRDISTAYAVVEKPLMLPFHDAGEEKVGESEKYAHEWVQFETKSIFQRGHSDQREATFSEEKEATPDPFVKQNTVKHLSKEQEHRPRPNASRRVVFAA